MSRHLFLSSAAAFLMVASCGNQGSGSSAAASTTQAALVQPGRIDAGALRSAVTDPVVQKFYQGRGWEAAWDEPRARSLLDALADAPRHGLEVGALVRDIENAASPAAREAALTVAALAYADVLANGMVDPTEIRSIYTLDRPRVNVLSGFAGAVQGGDVKGWLAGLAPDSAEYRALGDAYLAYRDEAAGRNATKIAGGDLIREGDSDARVPALAETLRDNGYLPSPPAGQGPPASTTYTADMAAAVERLQQDYGIASDGIVGPDTLAVLNAGAADRARQLAVNLERRRWLERDPPATRIDVNTAAAILDFWSRGERADRRKVIVGQPGWETPQLGSPIFRLVANPTWTVPKSIEREEIAPKGEAYLRRNNMVRRNGWIVQLPGPDNALGEVKFDMRNDYAIYLHDTPAKHLFDRNQRHFSHGCVRVEDALGFARMIAERGGKLAEFERAMATGEETFVDLDENIPVRLVYHSAFLGPDGKIAFRTDPYGWDEDVARKLGLGEGGGKKRVSAHIADVGP